jgi:hypothetical protein
MDINSVAPPMTEHSGLGWGIARSTHADLRGETCGGDDHPDVAHTLTNLSLVYSLQRKFGEAEVVLRRALEIQEKALGESDMTVAMTLGLLASACLGQGKDQEAKALQERGMSIMGNAMGRKRP